jgi:hypothetical protein
MRERSAHVRPRQSRRRRRTRRRRRRRRTLARAEEGSKVVGIRREGGSGCKVRLEAAGGCLRWE